MKIIFDSEEQKRHLLYVLIRHICPFDLDLADKYLSKDCGNDDNECMECWSKCGLVVEVNSEEH